MRTWIVPGLAGITHLVVVLAALLALGHPVPGPAALVGLLLLGALPVRWWRDGVRSPLVLAVLGLAAAVLLEIVTPGPWVTTAWPDVITVGTPVLWSWAVASPLWLAACGLLWLGSVSLLGVGRGRATPAGYGPSRPGDRAEPRRGSRDGAADRASRPGWDRAWLWAVAVTALWFAALVLTGLGRGWATSPPAVYGAVPAAILVLGATLLLRRSRLVAPWFVLLLVTGVAAAALWVQPPSGGADAAAGLLAGSTVSLALAIVLGLVEALVRGVVRLVRGPARMRLQNDIGAARMQS